MLFLAKDVFTARASVNFFIELELRHSVSTRNTLYKPTVMK